MPLQWQGQAEVASVGCINGSTQGQKTFVRRCHGHRWRRNRCRCCRYCRRLRCRGLAPCRRARLKIFELHVQQLHSLLGQSGLPPPLPQPLSAHLPPPVHQVCQDLAPDAPFEQDSGQGLYALRKPRAELAIATNIIANCASSTWAGGIFFTQPACQRVFPRGQYKHE